MAYINGQEVVFGAYIHGASGTGEWDYIISNTSKTSFVDQLDLAKGRVLVKGILVTGNITVPSAVTLIEFSGCNFGYSYLTKPDGDGNGGGIEVQDYCRGIEGHSDCTIRGVVSSGFGHTPLVISGFGAVEHCVSEGQHYLVVKDCERVLHCSLDSMENTKFISDCSIISDHIGSIKNCSNINNVYADSQADTLIEFTDCHIISNVRGENLDFKNCSLISNATGTTVTFESCKNITNATGTTVTYTDCIYVDPFTCKDFVLPTLEGYAIAFTTDGTLDYVRFAEGVKF